MPCTYVIYSSSKKHFYTGSSREDSSEARLKRHNTGRVKSTKNGKPWTLFLEEYYPTYTEARKRELFLKSGQGRKFIKESWQSGRMRRS